MLCEDPSALLPLPTTATEEPSTRAKATDQARRKGATASLNARGEAASVATKTAATNEQVATRTLRGSLMSAEVGYLQVLSLHGGCGCGVPLPRVFCFKSL